MLNLEDTIASLQDTSQFIWKHRNLVHSAEVFKETQHGPAVLACGR